MKKEKRHRILTSEAATILVLPVYSAVAVLKRVGSKVLYVLSVYILLAPLDFLLG